MTFMGNATITRLQSEVAVDPYLAALLGLVLLSMLGSFLFYGIAWLRNPGYFKSEAFQRRRNEPPTLQTPLHIWNHR